MSFKSCNPKKYATIKENNYRSSKTKIMKELCCTCGYPYGMHYVDICPTKKDIAERKKDGKDIIVPLRVKERKKLSR